MTEFGAIFGKKYLIASTSGWALFKSICSILTLGKLIVFRIFGIEPCIKLEFLNFLNLVCIFKKL
jgi:hypothetical protein